jgi:homospermidine synthase
LYKDRKTSFWQTPTITPVAMSALAAMCCMIENKDNGGIYFPDDICEYKEIINFAEKYISKTIYKTFKKKRIERELSINLNELQLNDILINKTPQ